MKELRKSCGDHCGPHSGSVCVPTISSALQWPGRRLLCYRPMRCPSRLCALARHPCLRCPVVKVFTYLRSTHESAYTLSRHNAREIWAHDPPVARIPTATWTKRARRCSENNFVASHIRGLLHDINSCDYRCPSEERKRLLTIILIAVNIFYRKNVYIRKMGQEVIVQKLFTKIMRIIKNHFSKFLTGISCEIFLFF